MGRRDECMKMKEGRFPDGKKGKEKKTTLENWGVRRLDRKLKFSNHFASFYSIWFSKLKIKEFLINSFFTLKKNP